MSVIPPVPKAKLSVEGVEREIGQIARGAGVGLGGNALNYFLSYLFGILVARQIGAENYGLYTLGVTAVTLVSRFTLVGLDRGLMRFASISRGQGQGRALRRLSAIALAVGAAVSLAGGLLFALFPATILAQLNKSSLPDMVKLAPVLALSIPALTLTGIAIAGTQAFRTMRYRALIVNVIQPILKLALTLVLILVFGANAMAPVLGFVLAQIAGTFLAALVLGRMVRQLSPTAATDRGQGRDLMRFSTPLMFSSVLDYLNGRTEILVLGIFLTANFVGIYNASVRLAGLGLIVLTAFNAIFSPVVSDLHHKKEMDQLGRLFKLVTRWVVTCSLPIFLIQMLFAPQLMALFGPEFVSGAMALRILSVGQFVNLATGAVGIMLIMAGRSDITFINSVVAVLASFALDFWLVRDYGLLGAALAGSTIIALLNLLRLGQVWWLMRLHPFDRTFARPLLATLPALAVGLAWLRWLPLNNIFVFALACAALGLAFVLAVLAMGLDDGDRLIISAMRVRTERMLPARWRRPRTETERT